MEVHHSDYKVWRVSEPFAILLNEPAIIEKFLFT